jgi:hypothetical protein
VNSTSGMGQRKEKNYTLDFAGNLSRPTPMVLRSFSGCF